MRFYANSMANLCEALGRDVSQLVILAILRIIIIPLQNFYKTY